MADPIGWRGGLVRLRLDDEKVVRKTWLSVISGAEGVRCLKDHSSNS